MLSAARAYLAHVFTCIGLAAAYLGRRVGEPSTWTGAVGAIAAAKEFPSPLNWLGIACGLVAILVPNRHGPDGCCHGGD